MEQDVFYIWLNEARGLPNNLKIKLLKIFGSPQAIFEACKMDLPKEYGALTTFGKYFLAKDLCRAERILAKNESLGIKLLTADNPLYLPKEKRNKKSPLLLYFMGNLPDWTAGKTVIVGSRKTSTYGEAVAKKAARDCVRLDHDVASGMAQGIDTFAHKEALAAGGRSLAFLANGLDICYPAENRELLEALLEKGTALSPFPVGTPPRKANFHIRNDIMTTWADNIIIVEAALKSGSMMTGNLGLSNGRRVYAVPNNIFLPQSAGCNFSLAKGAWPYLGDLAGFDENGPRTGATRGRPALKELPKDPILLSLIEEAQSTETLTLFHGKSLDELNAILAEYELDNKVKHLADGRWHFTGWGGE